MPTTSSLGPALDYLVTTIEALNLTSTADGGPPVYVSDGYPGVAADALDVVTIGGSVNPTEDGVADWAGLGGSAPLDEKYEIECIISCSRGGLEQKPARDAALGIYNAVQTAIRSDVTLGGAVRVARIAKFRLTQTSWENAAQGRAAVVEFHVAVEHRIQ